jgi:hypothetical protein
MVLYRGSKGHSSYEAKSWSLKPPPGGLTFIAFGLTKNVVEGLGRHMNMAMTP